MMAEELTRLRNDKAARNAVKKACEAYEKEKSAAAEKNVEQEKEESDVEELRATASAEEELDGNDGFQTPSEGETEEEAEEDSDINANLGASASLPSGNVVVVADSDRTDGIPLGEITLTAREIEEAVASIDIDQLCQDAAAADAEDHGNQTGNQREGGHSEQQNAPAARAPGHGAGSRRGASAAGGSSGAGGGGKGKAKCRDFLAFLSYSYHLLDDPPRRPPAKGPQTGGAQGEEDPSEDEAIDPSVGHRGPDKRSKLPKLTETQKDHQEWKWVMLVSILGPINLGKPAFLLNSFQFIWDESDPRFAPFWVHDLNPPISVPLQHDSLTRVRKHTQVVERGRGKKKQILNVEVSLFVKIEEGHSLKGVRNKGKSRRSSLNPKLILAGQQAGRNIQPGLPEVPHRHGRC